MQKESVGRLWILYNINYCLSENEFYYF